MPQKERRTPLPEPPDAAPDGWRADGALSPEAMLAEAAARGDLAWPSRRGFVAAGAFAAWALVAGCAPKRVVSSLPGAEWGEPGPMAPPLRETDGDAEQPLQRTMIDAAGVASTRAGPFGPAALPYARPRALWAKGAPDLSIMNPMLPVTAMTVHHDGMDDLVTTSAPRDMAARIERYRVGHRARGWGDIGYHLVIDRGGAVWQGRSVLWQGAHVKDHNEGNIGVLVMGNFEVQAPTSVQVATLGRVIADLRRVYRIPASRVMTHREWQGAQTLCPGRALQPRVDEIRGAMRA
ncbi:MAG: peptidoglycan recognition family protein [Planctomycetota bacterium]